MSLVHKYRPKRLSQVIGQTQVVKSLQGAIKQNRLHSAYLFAGSRGTGKTSVSRVLAKSLNCQKGITLEPCDECQSCKTIESGNSIDVFEVDAASNNGVDYARELIKGTSLSSMGGRHKIYIIDECHNLTKQASETLLKTVEEPGAKTIFIFCTTEPSKVLKTIESRCQTFKFNPVDEAIIAKHLNDIVTAEMLNVEFDLISAIAQLCDGVVRDAITILDQVSLNPDATVDDLYQLIGKVPSDHVVSVLDAVKSRHPINVYTALKYCYKSGVDPLQLLGEISNFVRNGLVYKQDSSAYKLMTCDTKTFRIAGSWATDIDVSKLVEMIIFLRQKEIDFSAAKIPKLFVEASLLEMMQFFKQEALHQAVQSLSQVQPQQKPVQPSDNQAFEYAWQQAISLECMAKLAPCILRWTYTAKQNLLTIVLPAKYQAGKDKAIDRLREAFTMLNLNLSFDIQFE